MATRNRALIAIKRALDRQSWGGKKGRFAVQRTLEHLRQNPVFLNDEVKAIRLNLRPPESLNHGAKQFLFENMPQLRYNNPNVEVTRSKNRQGDAALHIYFKLFSGSLVWDFSATVVFADLQEEGTNVAETLQTNEPENRIADGSEEMILTQEKTNLQILNDLARLASKSWQPTNEEHIQGLDTLQMNTVDHVENDNPDNRLN